MEQLSQDRNDQIGLIHDGENPNFGQNLYFFVL